MDDLRIILHRALPDTPPGVAISREAAIAAGRRERKRQRWLKALGAFLSTLLIAGGVAWGVSLRSPTALTYSGASPTGATATAAPAPSPTPVVVANPTLRADLDLAALSATLLARRPASRRASRSSRSHLAAGLAAPGVRVRPQPGRGQGLGRPQGRPRAWARCSST
jgi:hypothetical protein